MFLKRASFTTNLVIVGYQATGTWNKLLYPNTTLEIAGPFLHLKTDGVLTKIIPLTGVGTMDPEDLVPGQLGLNQLIAIEPPPTEDPLPVPATLSSDIWEAHLVAPSNPKPPKKKAAPKKTAPKKTKTKTKTQ